MSYLFLAMMIGAGPVECDLVIRGATIHDGSGKAPVVGDVAIRKDRIVAVGRFDVAGSPRAIDATNLVLAPGFIDLHTHCDTGENPITKSPGNKNVCYLTQGVTTVVTGNCGSGPVDTKAFYDTLAKEGVGTNVAHLVPHNSVRTRVMGNSNRGPTTEELQQMQALVDTGMKDGCWGMATGLIYTPGTYSKTEELIALSKVVGQHGGIYASHIRDEGSGLLTAIEEALKIGQEGKVPVHVSHIKATGKASWGRSADAVALITRAINAGHKVTADQYPYIASSTSLAATVVPTRFRDGTAKEYKARLDDPEKGPQIRKAIEEALASRDGGKRVQIARYRPNTAWHGKNIAVIAELEKKSPVDIVLEIERNGGAQIVHFGMSEEDVRMYMKQPWVATASDGSSQVPGDTVPHPRSYGTFPRKIGRYSIKDGAIPLEQAIRSASGLPADILGLKDRGYIREGQFADLVLFDPKSFTDTATFEKPHQYATGIAHVLVNGQFAIEAGKVQATLSGKPLRRATK